MFFRLIEVIAKMGQLCYEPVWIAGGIGIFLFWVMRSYPRSVIYWGVSAWIMMLLWRSRLSPVSSRYIVIVLIGVILFASYGVYSFPDFLARYRSISPGMKRLIRGGLLLLLIGSCLAKFFHTNSYSVYLVNAHKAITEDARKFGDNVAVLNFDSEEDDKRHRYYSQFPVFSGGMADSESFVSGALVADLVANSGYRAVYVLVRHRSGFPFSIEKENAGRCELYSSYTSRNKKYKLSVWRFIPSATIDSAEEALPSRLIREWRWTDALQSREAAPHGNVGNDWVVNDSDSFTTDSTQSIVSQSNGLSLSSDARLSLYCTQEFPVAAELQVLCRLSGRPGSRIELAAYYYDDANRYIGTAFRALELSHAGENSIVLPVPGVKSYPGKGMRLVFRLISGEICLKQMALFQK